MGFAHEEFNYRLCNSINKKIIKSKDVFLEDRSFENF